MGLVLFLSYAQWEQGIRGLYSLGRWETLFEMSPRRGGYLRRPMKEEWESAREEKAVSSQMCQSHTVQQGQDGQRAHPLLQWSRCFSPATLTRLKFLGKVCLFPHFCFSRFSSPHQLVRQNCFLLPSILRSIERVSTSQCFSPSFWRVEKVIRRKIEKNFKIGPICYCYHLNGFSNTVLVFSVTRKISLCQSD